MASRLRPGKYTVTLALRGTNCSVAGVNEVTVDVSLGTVAPVLFEVTCAAPIRSEKITFAVDTTIGGASETLIELVNPDGSGARVIGRGRTHRSRRGESARLTSGAYRAPAWRP